MSFSRNTPRVVDCKVALVQAFFNAKQALKELNHHAQAQAQEIERMKLELELLRAKQRYQDTGHALALSTSAAVLEWLRGEAPPPRLVEYRERFVDPATTTNCNNGRQHHTCARIQFYQMACMNRR